MFVLRVILEIFAVLLLAYGFWREEEIVEWEREKMRKIKKARQQKLTSRRKAKFKFFG